MKAKQEAAINEMNDLWAQTEHIWTVIQEVQNDLDFFELPRSVQLESFAY
jgi:hypothetical protein